MEEWVVGISILIGWASLMIGVSYLSTKYRKLDVRDYAIASGSLGIFVLTLTFSASYHSAYAFMGTTGFIYTHGLGWWVNGFWTVLPGIGLWIIGRRIWALGKRYGYLSIGEYVVGVYDSSLIGFLVAGIGFIFTLPYVAMQAIGIAYIFEVISSGVIGFEVGISIFFGIMVLIAWIGGLRGIAWTDAIQGIFMFIVCVLGAYFVALAGFGGITQVYEQGAEFLQTAYSLPGLSQELTSGRWLSLWIPITLGMLVFPHMFLRYFTGRSLRVIKWSGVFSAIYLTLLYILTPAVGIGAKVLYPEFSAPDQLFPVLLLRFTPFLFAALACAGALAASMSTADSQLHAVGTLLTVDVYKKFINPKATGKKLFKLDRWLIVILGLISALVALLKLGIFIELLALATGGMAVLFFPLIAPLYWKRATKTGALLSISLGEATLIATSFISLPWNTLPGLWGVLVSALVLIITSLLTSKMPKIEETVSYLEKAFDKKK